MRLTSESEIESVIEGGKKLALVKSKLAKKVKEGVSAYEIDQLAQKLISEEGGESSFKSVKDYHWTTCINVNTGVVHGIPGKNIIFKKDDIVSVDVGMYYQGFHTDTSFSVYLGDNKKQKNFLLAGEQALNAAIKAAKPGNRIYDISEAIYTTLDSHKLTPVWSLTGHGIGRKLHEEPYIPCYPSGKYNESPVIAKGDMYAIEVMYTTGSGEVELADDGWTIVTADDKIAGLFEETVIVQDDGPLILTRN